MSQSRIVRLGELIDLQSGGTPSKQRPQYWNGELPWVSPKDVKINRIHRTEDTVTEEAIGNGTRAVGAGTLLLVVRSMILAREVPLTVVQRRMCFNQDIKAITPKNGIRNDFLIAWFFAHRSAILGIVDEAGHGTKRIQTDRLLALPVHLPSEPEQRRIASILGEYDNLIEVNRRRIAVLEEMARRSFDEWFVQERTPTGEAFLPALLGEVADIEWGDTNTTKASYVPEGYIAFSASGPDGLLDHFDYEGLGIVLSAIGAQCGKIWLADGQWSTIKNTIVIRAREDQTTTSILYLLLNKSNIWPRRGAAQPFISQGDARKIQIRLPSLSVQRQFDQMVAPMLKQYRTLDRANIALAKSRDLLLPRLISGVLSTSAAERELEAVA